MFDADADVDDDVDAEACDTCEMVNIETDGDAAMQCNASQAENRRKSMLQ